MTHNDSTKRGPALDQIVYLTGCTNPKVTGILTSDAHRDAHGLLTQPGSYGDGYIRQWPRWAADNGCFAKGDKFDEAAWLEWLAALAPDMRDACMFAVAPDVLCDPEATLRRSLPHLRAIRELGYRPAFVAQDGVEADMDRLIPWAEFDILFLGGSTEWKLDPERAGRVAAEALRRGKTVHMGRVNSRKRLRLAAAWGCESVDGTFLAFGPEKNLPRLLAWRESSLKEQMAMSFETEWSALVDARASKSEMEVAA